MEMDGNGPEKLNISTKAILRRLNSNSSGNDYRIFNAQSGKNLNHGLG
jgi:hypothetical protein